MIKLINKNKIILLSGATFALLLLACVYYFVPFNVVWVTGDDTLRRELKIDLYQQTDLCCGYERVEVYSGSESIFMIHQEYGEHRFLLKYESCYEKFGFFKNRAWYDMFTRFRIYNSGDKVYCDVFHLMGLSIDKRTICVEGDSELKKHLDEFICMD